MTHLISTVAWTPLAHHLPSQANLAIYTTLFLVTVLALTATFSTSATRRNAAFRVLRLLLARRADHPGRPDGSTEL